MVPRRSARPINRNRSQRVLVGTPVLNLLAVVAALAVFLLAVPGIGLVPRAGAILPTQAAETSFLAASSESPICGAVGTSISSSGSGEWERLGDLQTTRVGLAAAVDNDGCIYAIAGDESGSVEVYDSTSQDPSTGWRTLGAGGGDPSKFTVVAQEGLAAATDQWGRIYAIGGTRNREGNGITSRFEREFLDVVQRFDSKRPDEGWVTVTPMPTPRAGLAAAAWVNPDDGKGRIYAFGGMAPFAGRADLPEPPAGAPPQPSAVNTVEVYTPDDPDNPNDPPGGTWTRLENSLEEQPGNADSLPSARAGMGAATALDGRIYVIGGSNDDGAPLKTVEVFDPATKSWSLQEPLAEARGRVGAVTGSDGRVYAIGGSGRKTIETYIPRATPSQLPEMQFSRMGLAAAAGKDGRIYAIGGYDWTKTVEAYRPGQNRTPPPPDGPCVSQRDSGWDDSLAPLSAGRVNLASATGRDGRIYAIGGHDPQSFDVHKSAELCDPLTDKWRRLSDMSTGRTGLAVAGGVASDDRERIYIFGGRLSARQQTSVVDSVEAYDPFTDRWEPMKAMPTARAGAAAVNSGGLIYVIGGMDRNGAYLKTVEIYDPRSETWTQSPLLPGGNGPAPMPTGRAYLSVVAGGGERIYAMGGEIAFQPSSVVEAYDPSSKKWSTLASMPAASSGFGAAKDIYGRIYAISESGDSNGLGLVNVYTPTTDLWEEGVPPPGGTRNGLAATTANDGRIYILGGSQKRFGGRADAVEILTPAPPRTPLGGKCSAGRAVVQMSAQKWTSKTLEAFYDDRLGGTLPRGFHAHSAAAGLDGRIYALGEIEGRYDPRQYDVLVAYTPSPQDPLSGTWERKASLPTDRRRPAMVTGRDGRIYVMGGDDGSRTQVGTPSKASRVVEAYDPCSDIWSRLAPMPTGRAELAASLGPDGRIYALGGNLDSPGAPTAAEAYDPTTNTWSSLPPMTQPRAAGLGAARGPDGRIYAVGGNNVGAGGSGAGGSVEAFNPCTMTWNSVKSLNTARLLLASTTGPDDRIYVVGGFVGPTPTKLVEAYDAGLDSWGSKAPTPEAQALTTATTGTDGRIYVLNSSHLQVYEADMSQRVNIVSVCPSLRVNDTEVNEDAGPAIFTLSLDVASTVPVQVAYETKDGTAKAADGHYQAVKGSLIFLPGEKEKKVPVPVNKSDIPEGNKTFTLDLKLTGVVPGAIMGDPEGQATIVDSPLAADPSGPPSASIGDLTVPEPYNQTAPAVFTLTLDKPAPQDLTFSYKTEEGRATEGADYQKAQGQVSIPKGGTSALIPTTVIGDTKAEPTENFFLQISKGEGATLQKAKGEAKILDAGPGISVGDVSITEGNSAATPAVFTVVANSAPLERASVRFTTHQGTAKPSDDYLEQLEQITFEPGQVAKIVTVQVKGDTTPEQDEDFS
ncbi:MAG: kelch repeat-containing protein, partial [Actinomycetota bacterium]